MTRSWALRSFRLKHYKAIRDSGTVKLGPLTVFIGNNGVGKSSLIEGLQTYRRIVTENLDEALSPWLGFEHIRNKASRSGWTHRGGRRVFENPITFRINGLMGVTGTTEMTVGYRDGDVNRVHVISEQHTRSDGAVYRRHDRTVKPAVPGPPVLEDGESILGRFSDTWSSVASWQFLLLEPNEMGYARPVTRTSRKVYLAPDGSNVAEYLLDIRTRDQDAFDGIVEAMEYVLPYARDVQPTMTSELERAAYLQLTEDTYKVPGWLLSTGTLRVLALLGLLRDPEPPPLLVVEEIENGLDPRTLNLIVEELRRVVFEGRTQVILTTHSPYLLDLLDLSQIILVERGEDGAPTFTRPGDNDSLDAWAAEFSPGRLYTMGRLNS